MTNDSKQGELKAALEGSGAGWYEWLTDGSSETRIAYVQESGEVYLPEGGDEAEFFMASARGRAWKLVRAVDITPHEDGMTEPSEDAVKALAEEMARRDFGLLGFRNAPSRNTRAEYEAAARATLRAWSREWTGRDPRG